MVQQSNYGGGRQGGAILDEMNGDDLSEKMIFKQRHEEWECPAIQ